MKKSIGGIIHVGITVAQFERAKKFYGEVLGLKFKGEMIMEGESTDNLFGIQGSSVQVAYYNGSNRIGVPPIELICFKDKTEQQEKRRLEEVGISEICFGVKDIDKVYAELKSRGVEFLSTPQYFDLSGQGFGKSKAVYFKDSEGNILELLEEID